MNILIAGSDINAILIAQYIKQQNKENDIYITTENLDSESECISINIKESDVAAICDFVKYNQIEFTIVTSPIAIINGIADELKKEGFLVFAPFSESARITYLNSVAKKIMYKLKIPTPKFGIFDRENLAVEYARNAKLPIIVQNDLTLISRQNEIFKTFLSAKKGIKKIFEENEKIIIENYIDSEPVYIYFITDGYNAFPLVSLEREIQSNYSKIISSSQKISKDILYNILQKVIYPLLDDIKQYSNSYIGILGIKVIVQKTNFYVLEFYNEFQNYDILAFLSLLNDNLLRIMIEAANGNLVEKEINFCSSFSYTLAINKNFVQRELDEINDDCFEIEDSKNYIITTTSLTSNQAKIKLYNEIMNICSKNLLKEIKENDTKKEKRI